MAKYSGRRIAVGIAKEASRGVAEGAAEYWLPAQSFNAMETLTKARDDSGFATIETPVQSDVIREWMEGELEMNVRSKSIGLLLLALLGTEDFDNDAPEANVGTHVFSVANNNVHPSLTLYENNPNRAVAASGVVATSATIEAALDQYVRISVGLMGKTFEDYASTVAYTTESKFRPQDVSVKFATTKAGLAGASATTGIESLTLEINKNVEQQNGLGSIDPIDHLNLGFEVSGQITLMHEDDVELDWALDNTYRAMEITITNTDYTVGTATNPSLKIQLNQVDFDEPEIDKGLNNRAVLTLSFTGHYKISETEMIEATLINDVNTAY